MLHHAAPCSTMLHHAPPCCTMLHHAAPCYELRTTVLIPRVIVGHSYQMIHRWISLKGATLLWMLYKGHILYAMTVIWININYGSSLGPTWEVRMCVHTHTHTSEFHVLPSQLPSCGHVTGKSTFLRQNALIIILAQVRTFVAWLINCGVRTFKHPSCIIVALIHHCMAAWAAWQRGPHGSVGRMAVWLVLHSRWNAVSSPKSHTLLLLQYAWNCESVLKC